MDMKRILQAMDGVAKQPVKGASDMSKFLSIIDKNDVSIIKEEINNNKVLNEGANPHKVTLPVQMAMQHYQATEPKQVLRTKPTSTINKYFHEVEQEQLEEQNHKRQLIKQYSQTIAERVMMKESGVKTADLWKAKVMSTGPGLQDNTGDGGHLTLETPLDFNPEEPMGSEIHSHQGVNPASIQSRIMRARRQMQELAKLAESNDPGVWQHIANLFPELQMNIEQVRHGLEELSKIKKMGGTRSRNISKF
jgi:hypothetical protein